MMRRVTLLLAGVACTLLFLLMTGARAQTRIALDDRYRVSVLTFGPGDDLFAKFGHNALLVEDRLRKREDVYNFGTFDFESPTLMIDFLKGRLRYSLSVEPLSATRHHYQNANRRIYVQELRLSSGLEEKLVNALEHNALPENRTYEYDYYLDNCSTRVRDVLDALLDGRLHAAAMGPARMTWRAHTLRLTADDLPVYVALDLAMGASIDQPITRWQEMFLPEKLQETLRGMTVSGAQGDQPLVQAERVLFAADRDPVRREAPHWTVPMLVAGIGLGGLLAGLAELGARLQPARYAYLGLLGLMGLALGLVGVILAFLWLGTDHRVTDGNENLLQCPPWALALVVSAPLAAFGHRALERLTWHLLLVCCAGSLLGFVLNALPWLAQSNGQLVVLLLPLWGGALVGAWRLELNRPRSRRLGARTTPWHRR